MCFQGIKGPIGQTGPRGPPGITVRLYKDIRCANRLQFVVEGLISLVFILFRADQVPLVLMVQLAGKGPKVTRGEMGSQAMMAVLGDR